MAACERIFKLLDTQPEIVSPAHPVAGDGSNRIEFRHVWFTYQKLNDEQQASVAAAAGSDAPAARLAAIEGVEWILKDVSFTVEPGQTVAIVGHTGAGKTTLTSLMMRFYEVTAGEILLDGVDLREAGFDRAAAALCGGAAGSVSVCRNGGRQHPLRQQRDQRRRPAAGGAGRECAGLYREPAGGLQRAGAGAGQLAVDGAEATDQLCARAGLQSADSDSGRSNFKRRHRYRTAHSRGSGADGGGTHLAC